MPTKKDLKNKVRKMADDHNPAHQYRAGRAVRRIARAADGCEDLSALAACINSNKHLRTKVKLTASHLEGILALNEFTKTDHPLPNALFDFTINGLNP